jgi:uncharacterized membrane protein
LRRHGHSISRDVGAIVLASADDDAVSRPSVAKSKGGRTTPREERRLPRPLRTVGNHARLFGSTFVGVAAFAVHTYLAPGTRFPTRVLIGWDIGTLVYLVGAFRLMSRFDLDLVRRRAAIQDEGGMGLFLLTVAAAVASLAAIVAELGSIGDVPNRAPYFVLAALTIVLSWTFIHVLFALHYAHEYYDESGEQGLLFPQEDCPDYWDFVYFSFVVGMTFQVSDVQVTRRSLRRLVVVHGLVSFVFNVAILALVVNLAASLIDA